MKTICQISTELILAHTPPNTTATLIVPADTEASLDAEMRDCLGRGLDPRFTAPHPLTGEHTKAFLPVSPGRLAMIQRRGVRHGDRFLATFAVNEKHYQGQPRREMWLAEAQPLG